MNSSESDRFAMGNDNKNITRKENKVINKKKETRVRELFTRKLAVSSGSSQILQLGKRCPLNDKYTRP
jgi:hypothetical protein